MPKLNKDKAKAFMTSAFGSEKKKEGDESDSKWWDLTPLKDIYTEEFSKAKGKKKRKRMDGVKMPERKE